MPRQNGFSKLEILDFKITQLEKRLTQEIDALKVSQEGVREEIANLREDVEAFVKLRLKTSEQSSHSIAG